jgi:ABC-type Mn2+/Zn2+ transport system ATPase subunit
LACLVVCLAVQEPDVLLLDEPTNHLDLDAIEWLEGYLKQQVGRNRWWYSSATGNRGMARMFILQQIILLHPHLHHTAAQVLLNPCPTHATTPTLEAPMVSRLHLVLWCLHSSNR